MQRLDNGPTSFLAHRLSSLGRLTADLRLDGVEPGDLGQHGRGERRLRRGMELEKRAAHMDHPNTIDDLRFVLSVPFSAPAALRRRGRLAG
jgi:hypothetical protein